MNIIAERIAIESEAQWLEARKQDVTASDIAALIGLHPFKTAMELFCEKQGLEGLSSINPTIARRGRLLEPVVAAAVQEERPDWTIWKAREYLRLNLVKMKDGIWRGIGCTPDFFYTDETNRRGVLQAKTVAPSSFRASWTPEAPPSYIALQTATEAMLCDAEVATIAALVVDGWHFAVYLYDVPRNLGAERRLLDAVEQFWTNVNNNVEPRIDYERDGDLLALMYPKESPGKVVDLRFDNMLPELLDERERLKATIAEAETRKDAIETELKAKIGDGESANIRGWRVTLKQQHRKEHMVKATSFRKLHVAREFAA